MDAGTRGIDVFWDNGPVRISELDEQLQVQAWGWAWREARLGSPRTRLGLARSAPSLNGCDGAPTSDALRRS